MAAHIANQPSKRHFGPRLCPNKKLIMLLAASISRFLFLFQDRYKDRPTVRLSMDSLSKSICWAAGLKYSRCSPHRDARACTPCSAVDYKSSSCLVWSFNPVVFMTGRRAELGSMTYCVLLDGMSVSCHWFIAISNQNHLRTSMSDYIEGLISS